MQVILGHKDIDTTLGIYADATENLKKREMINFEQYFSDKSREQKEKENTEKKEDNENNEDS